MQNFRRRTQTWLEVKQHKNWALGDPPSFLLVLRWLLLLFCRSFLGAAGAAGAGSHRTIAMRESLKFMPRHFYPALFVCTEGVQEEEEDEEEDSSSPLCAILMSWKWFVRVTGLRRPSPVPSLLCPVVFRWCCSPHATGHEEETLLTPLSWP